MINSSPIVIKDIEDLSNPKSSAGEITVITPENKTYFGPDSGYYPGTYGFEDELPGIYGENIEFLDEYHGSYVHSSYYWIKTYPSRDGHNNLLVMADAQGGSYTSAVHNIKNPQSSGTIEFYLWSAFNAAGSTLQRYYFQLRSSSDTIAFGITIELQLSYGRILYYNGSSWQEIAQINLGDWYHHSINFDCNAGINGQFSWIIKNDSGTEVGRVDNIEFENDLSTLDEIYFGSTLSDYGGETFWDAFGFSWAPNYNVGDNLNEGLLLSYDNTTTLDWQGYSLDGQANKTIMGNTTIPLPSDGVHSIQLFGNDSMGVMYESQVNYFSVHHINIVNPEAKVYTEPDSGYYPATYGFENDLIGSNPSDWIVSEVGATIDVINSLGGHNKIVEINKDGSSSYPHIKNVFSIGQQGGTVEFWMRSNDVTQSFLFYIMTAPAGVGARITIGMLDDYFIWNDGSVVYNIVPCIDNTWYKIRVDFECGSGAYEGLSADHFYIHINGQRYGEFPFRDPGSIMEHVEIWVWEPSVICYLDAIGYSWDPSYSIGNNLNEGLLLSYDNSTTLDWKGYSLDGHANKTILGNTTIQMPSEGTHQIQVFGNDSLGTMYESAVRHFSVDIIPPEISITYPSAAQEFSDPPAYILSITEENIAAMWYTLNGGTGIPVTSETGTIDSSAWNSLADGPVTIRFYVRDIADRETFEEVIVVKLASEVPTPPPGIPGYNLIALLGVITLISTMIIRKRVKS